MSETNSFHTEPCKNLDDFVRKTKRIQKNGFWIYRGQQNPEWNLTTTFERACQCFLVKNRAIVEQNMIREFRRRLHHYMDNLPDEHSYDEWLALMQHHGAPTRLLDFTYSPYVAAYFALEHAEPDCNVAIWAVNAGWCEEELKRQFKGLHKHYKTYQKKRESQEFNSIFMLRSIKRIQKFVLPVNPFRLNERLAYQRGVFLCPGDVRVCFMDNLSDFIGSEGLNKKVIKYTIPTGNKGKIRNDALKLLDLMNINRITLFPGLDGFAQSFWARIPSLFSIQGKH